MNPFILGIPTYENYDLLHGLLLSVERSPIKPIQAIIVDNSRQLVLGRNHYSFPITVVKPHYNFGCAKSWNTIGKLVRPFDVVISNDDIEVQGDSFEKLLVTVGSTSPIRLGCGFSFFLMREVAWRLAGCFDEAYWPCYYEDFDFRLMAESINMPIDDLGKIVKHVGEDHSKKNLSFGGTNKWLERNRAYCIEKWGVKDMLNLTRVYDKPWAGKSMNPMEWQRQYSGEELPTTFDPRKPDEEALWHHLSLIL